MTNGVIIQFFHWYNPDNTLWDELKGKVQDLVDAGFSAVWIPPCYKENNGGSGVGYGAYDLFDLGEFHQKESTRTKYGTKTQLLDTIKTVQHHGLQVYADVIFNHKDGGDAIETIWAQEVDWNDRNRAISDWYQIDAWTSFTFPGRDDKYSSMKWHWWCFDALTYNARTHSNDRIYRIQNKTFSTEVSHEHGNYEYLMANDLDLGNEFVRGELFYWGRWFVDTTQVDGFRIDAVKHIRSGFFKDWLNHLRVHFGGRELFSVGEYWSPNVDELHDYIAASEGRLSLVDVPLHYKFSEASKSGSNYSFLINKFLWARKAYGFGERHDYFDHPNTIAWIQLGDRNHPGAMAVVLSNGAAGNKWMNTFRPNVTFADSTGHITDLVETNHDGWGNFRCNGGSVSVWLQK